MSTDVFTGVISSSPLDVCGKVLLNQTCVKGSGGYDCLCTNVKTSKLEVLPDAKGNAAVVALTLELEKGILEWSPIRKAIGLSGFKADYEVRLGGLERGIEVVATFDVSGKRRENEDLRAYVLESSI